jgi:hypothetical protein
MRASYRVAEGLLYLSMGENKLGTLEYKSKT